MIAGLDFTWLSDPLYGKWLIQGTLMTIAISIVGMAAAFAFGVVGAAVIHLRTPLLQTLARILVDLFRNTPPLVQLFFLYFMLSEIGLNYTDAAGRSIPLFGGFACVVLSLGFYNGAMAVEIIRSGINGVPPQTIEGARSLGYSHAQTFWRVELPMALRLTVPAMTNNVVSLIKTSAQASLIAVADVMYYANQIMLENFRNLEVMLVVWAIYIVIASAFTVLAHGVERLLHIPGYGAQA
jgi:polar amino acid transport system permease protein